MRKVEREKWKVEREKLLTSYFELMELQLSLKEFCFLFFKFGLCEDSCIYKVFQLLKFIGYAYLRALGIFKSVRHCMGSSPLCICHNIGHAELANSVGIFFSETVYNYRIRTGAFKI